jgi:uncharacterized protein (DUF2252 family)
VNAERMRYPTTAEQHDAGRALRQATPRPRHAVYDPAPDRPDPVAVLEQQALTRVPELVPIRYGRMAPSPFTFLRGAAAIMAGDLAATPTSGIRVQSCGDCHLSNFGFFATPERTLVFDLNDFDETLPAPFEWDLKRLAASVVVAARSKGFRRKECRNAARACVGHYRTEIHRYAPMGHLDTWYARMDVAGVHEFVKLTSTGRRRLDKAIGKAQGRTSLQAFTKFAEKVNGTYRIKDDPPLIQHVDLGDLEVIVESALAQMTDSMSLSRHVLLERYRFADVALKVVGVGSVGTRAYMVLLTGKDDSDPLFLQFKQAEASVLEPYAGASEFVNHGQRVVSGQHLIQAASDVFLGWITSSLDDTVHYYFRQLRDMKGGIDVEPLPAKRYVAYVQACGAALARAHARSGEAATIAGYLGRGDAFDAAIVEFADAYADQTERDHAALVDAIKTG